MAWSRLQSAFGSNTISSTLGVTYSSNVSAGTKLIAYVVSDVGVAYTLNSVKDGAGNTFTLAGGIQGAGAGGTTDVHIYFLDTPAGDVGTKPTITATFSTTTSDTSMIVQEVSGLAPGNTTVAALDGSAATKATAQAATIAQPAFTSTAANEFFVVLFGDDGSGETYTAPAGYTADPNNKNTNTTNDIAVEYKNSTGGAEGTPNWTFTSPGSNDCCFVAVAFQIAATVSTPYAQPGQTWRRYFKHPQQQLGAVTSSGTPASVTGVVANVNVNAQFSDQGIAIYSAPSLQFPQAPTTPYPLNLNPSLIVLRPQYTISPLVPVPGTTGNVNVSAPAGSINIYQNFNQQFPEPPILNPALGFNASYVALRQQYSTSLPDVFVPGTTANVNVTGPAGTVTELIDGTGQTANVNVAAPAGSILITQNFNPQAPFPPLLNNSIQFNPSYIALRQQEPSNAVFVSATIVSGVTANVNVVAQPGTVTELIDGTGVAGNVNVSAPAGIVTIYTETFQPFPQLPVVPNVLKFNPAFQTLRVQTSTALPDVFVPGSTANVSVAGPSGTVTELIDGTGQVSNVSVVAQPGQIQIFQNNNPPFPDSPILPSSLRFNPAYASLRPQYSTALPDVFVPGATANVNVSGQVDNSVTESVSGTVGQVNVSAPAGMVSVPANIPPQFVFTPQLPNAIRFNPVYEALRVQYNTGTPVVLGGIFGLVSGVTVLGQPDNTVTEIIPGAVSAVTVAAQAGTVVVSTSATVNVSVAAPSGTTVDSVSATVNVSVTAQSGSLLTTISGNSANVNAAAVPGSFGGGTPTIVNGPTVNVVVFASAGGLEYINNTTWWRVYRGYGQSPVW